MISRSGTRFRLVVSLVLVVTPALSATGTANVVFPSDAGIVDVRTWGAVPDDGVDDTFAIQRTLNAHPSGNHVFYFADGEYLISAPLRPAISSGVTKRNIFQGQSETGTVLQLLDHLDFRDAVIDFRTGPAQFFRNSVRNLTIDIGLGNPQASGLKFNASNQGTVAHVTIRSRQGGNTGLDLRHSDEIGPLLVRDVTIEGFAIGIHTGWQTASQTFENVTLRDQSERGWVNESAQAVFARKILSENDVTAIWNESFRLPGDGQGKFVLLDSLLQGLEGAQSRDAVVNQKAMYLRNVTTPGYGLALDSRIDWNRGNGDIHGSDIIEYWANGAYDTRRGGPFELFASPDTSLGLEVHDVPSVPWDDPVDWAGPHQFRAAPNDGSDDTRALQEAIDSRARTVYLPRGTWHINGTIELDGNVQRFIGSEAKIEGQGRIRLMDGTADTVVVERLEGGGLTYEHASSRTWVFQDLLGWSYEPAFAGVGDVYVQDVTGSAVRFHRQKVWARQLNIETDTEDDPRYEAKLVNDGATVWILGYKTENAGTLIKTINGGYTELLGAKHVGGFGDEPTFVTIESSFVSVVATGTPNRVQETRAGITRDGSIGQADIYTAFAADTIGFRKIIVDNADANGCSRSGQWSSSHERPGGFIGKDFLYANPGRRFSFTCTFTPDLPNESRYEVFLRWVNDTGGEDHSGHATNTPVRIDFDGGSTNMAIDQRSFGGQWYSLGVYDFQQGRNGSVTVGSEGADGKVITDAVRFVQVVE